MWDKTKENIEAPSMATASISTKGRAVRDRFRQNRQKGKHDDLEKDDEASRQKIHPR